ncbi:MAG: hypothetical protein LBU70_02960, partial [Chitinispirillales bacterium]|nr:hypothetical protein [Chitinispirillales bacterium]
MIMEQTILILACMSLIIIYYTFAHMATFTAKTAAVATKTPFLPLDKTSHPPPPHPLSSHHTAKTNH